MIESAAGFRRLMPPPLVVQPQTTVRLHSWMACIQKIGERFSASFLTRRTAWEKVAPARISEPRGWVRVAAFEQQARSGQALDFLFDYRSEQHERTDRD